MTRCFSKRPANTPKFLSTGTSLILPKRLSPISKRSSSSTRLIRSIVPPSLSSMSSCPARAVSKSSNTFAKTPLCIVCPSSSLPDTAPRQWLTKRINAAPTPSSPNPLIFPKPSNSSPPSTTSGASPNARRFSSQSYRRIVLVLVVVVLHPVYGKGGLFFNFQFSIFDFQFPPMTAQDLLQLPSTDPTSIYRYRDGLYAVDLLTAAISHLDFFTWLNQHPSDL